MVSTMANIFGATSTTEDVLSGIDLRGKRILVTGVSAGLRTWIYEIDPFPTYIATFPLAEQPKPS